MLTWAIGKKQFDLEALINGKPAIIVKRNIGSPALSNGVLTIDNLGIQCPSIDAETVVTLKLSPAK